MSGISLLLQLGTNQVPPLVEHALQPQLGQSLTGALEEEFPLMLLLGTPLPATIPKPSKTKARSFVCRAACGASTPPHLHPCTPPPVAMAPHVQMPLLQDSLANIRVTGVDT